MKKRPNTDSHNGKRNCGERSAMAGRKQKCANTMPPTHTATASRCRKSASSIALIMLFSSPDDAAPPGTTAMDWQRLLSAFDRALCTQFRALAAFPSVL